MEEAKAGEGETGSLLVVGLAAIRGNRLLLVQDREGAWLTPGGKACPDEGEAACLEREVFEEICCLPIGAARFWESAGLTPRSGISKRFVFYLGEVEGEPQETEDAVRTGWYSLSEAERLPGLTAITRLLLAELEGMGRLVR